MSYATRDLRSSQNRRSASSAKRAVDPFRGKLINGRFRVVGRLAVTAMSRVYQGKDELTGRRVAIKVLETRDRRPEMRKKYQLRFFREAEALARLTHPHIVQVLDHGIENNIPYLVMEFLEGNTLRALLRLTQPDPRAAITMVEHVTRALGAAHEQGIVHRDIKPSNLFVTGDLHEGTPIRVRLIDFGIAKDLDDTSDLTGHDTVLGTPWYMAPEQTLGDPVDGRADIYALGCLLFRLLMGRTPFGDKRGTGVLMAHVTQAPPLFSSVQPDHNLPLVIEWTVRRCLEKDPDKRFADVHELRRALQVCRRALDNPAFVPRLELVKGRVRAVSQELDVEPRRAERTPPSPHEEPDTLHTTTTTEPESMSGALLRWMSVGFVFGGALFWATWLVLRG